MNVRWKDLEGEWRKQLLSYSRGRILEIGVGHGGSFKYYPPGVHVTAIDPGPRTIEKAKLAAEAHAVKATFLTATVNELDFSENSFDTIICTFSLSAYDKPAAVLEQFNKWCKPDGLVLLMEYGLSKYNLVNWLQRKWEPYHYRKTGTHINRDLLSIISESKLRVRKVEVKYAGIVYLVWASLIPKRRVCESLLELKYMN